MVVADKFKLAAKDSGIMMIVFPKPAFARSGPRLVPIKVSKAWADQRQAS